MIKKLKVQAIVILLTVTIILSTVNSSAFFITKEKDSFEKMVTPINFNNLTSETCYAFLIKPSKSSFQTLGPTRLHQGISNCINDLLRLNCSVLWAAESQCLKARYFQKNDPISVQMEKGDFIIPISKNKSQNDIILSIIHEYITDTTFIHSYQIPSLFYITEPCSFQSYSLNQATISYYFSSEIDSLSFFHYLNIAHKNGFFDTNIITDSKQKILNRNKNAVFICPGLNIYLSIQEQIQGFAQTMINLNIKYRINEFVRNGGCYVGSCYGATMATLCSFMVNIPFIHLPLFGCINVSIINQSHPISYGLPSYLKTFYYEGPISLKQNSLADNIAVYNGPCEEGSNLLFPKWINNLPEKLHQIVKQKYTVLVKDNPIWNVRNIGSGKVISFSDHPEMSIPYHHDRIIQNALFYGTSSKKSMNSCQENLSILWIETLFDWYSTCDLPEKNIEFTTLKANCTKMKQTVKQISLSYGMLQNIKESYSSLGIIPSHLKDTILKGFDFELSPWLNSFEQQLDLLERLSSAYDQYNLSGNLEKWIQRAETKLQKSSDVCEKMHKQLMMLSELVTSYDGRVNQEEMMLKKASLLTSYQRNNYQEFIPLWAEETMLLRDLWYYYKTMNVADYNMSVISALDDSSFLSQEKNAFLGLNQQDSNIIYVDDDAEEWEDGTKNYPFSSIQHAIEVSYPLDTIYVASGWYNETLLISKSLTIIGEDKDSTVIDGCHQPYHVVRITASNVSLTNFSIINSSSRRYSCGICLFSSNNTIKDCIISGHSFGIGMNFNTYDNKIMKNKIHHNTGCGIIIDHHSQMRTKIIENELYANQLCNIRLLNIPTDVINNSMDDAGLYVIPDKKDLLIHFDNNSINDTLLLCLADKTDVVIMDSAASFLLWNCSNCSIINVSLQKPGGYCGGLIANSNQIQFSGSFYHFDIGLQLYNVESLTVRNSSFVNNSIVGLHIKESMNGIIENNLFRENCKGIVMQSSQNNQIISNRFINQISGMISSSSANQNQIDSNHFMNSSCHLVDRGNNRYENNFFDDWIGHHFSWLTWTPYYIPGSLYQNWDYHPSIINC